MMNPSDIKKIEISLFPDGRAWDFNTGGIVSDNEASLFTDGVDNIFTDGVGNYFTDGSTVVNSPGDSTVDAGREIMAEFMNDVLGMLDQLVPDNDNFDLNDVENFEREYGLSTYDGQTIEERKNAIKAKLYISEQDYKGVAEYLQSVLRDAGFDVYVHQNRFPIVSTSTKYGRRKYGNAVYGINASDGSKYDVHKPSLTYTSYAANYIDYNEEIERTGTLNEIESNSVNFGCFFFISGINYDDLADVKSERITELRTIVIKNKPAHLVAVFNINEI